MKRQLKLVEKTKIWFIISLIMIVISLGALAIRGLNFGIDFVGGTIVTIDLHTTFNTDDARKITDKYDKNADITYSGDAQEQIVISTKESLTTEQRTDLFDAFKAEYKLTDADLVSVDTITPSVGTETARNAVLASVVAMALMLVYITFRFEFYFGLAAVLALVHDIVVVIGVYALFQIQVNAPFIAAVLTILGYSINDTIVVFDRIRENENVMGMQNLTTLVDASVNQTLKRSINTVATTLIAILALYIFGVAAIKDFALPLIVGIACGCYSSIFVASPLWVVFQKKFKNTRYNTKQQKKNNRKRRDKRQEKAPQV
ncbi:MAG: protein translocase subunit SecF [Eubacterium aggregans]|uniref:Protein-export membrane protein SecF n=1 Tax=Eubacterium aggregans TaxID=81409 RepID=A0A1H4A520_9FIRM|nr:protein translocase subunit SecF [Eubacterium aggregans]MDD4690937.1 protein translocase subunit SecF [Eubacterium aggregans]MEA5074300.1 protein translocase subunit SecF [Eubacterium aggregans]SEA31119.1 protein translocase subunit secF [Eubacterium aggregans]